MFEDPILLTVLGLMDIAERGRTISKSIQKLLKIFPGGHSCLPEKTITGCGCMQVYVNTHLNMHMGMQPWTQTLHLEKGSSCRPP